MFYEKIRNNIFENKKSNKTYKPYPYFVEAAIYISLYSRSMQGQEDLFVADDFTENSCKSSEVQTP